MSNGMKTTMTVVGTAVATTVAIDLITGGAVRDAVRGMFSTTKDCAIDACECCKDSVKNTFDTVTDSAETVSNIVM